MPILYDGKKKKKGELYEPDTLTSFKNSLQRILSQHESPHDIKVSPAFGRSNLVLKSRRKELTKLGKGNRPNATRSLDDEEVDILYDKKYKTYSVRFGGCRLRNLVIELGTKHDNSNGAMLHSMWTLSEIQSF